MLGSQGHDLRHVFQETFACMYIVCWVQVDTTPQGGQTMCSVLCIGMGITTHSWTTLIFKQFTVFCMSKTQNVPAALRAAEKNEYKTK